MARHSVPDCSHFLKTSQAKSSEILSPAQEYMSNQLKSEQFRSAIAGRLRDHHGQRRALLLSLFRSPELSQPSEALSLSSGTAVFRNNCRQQLKGQSMKKTI